MRHSIAFSMVLALLCGCGGDPAPPVISLELRAFTSCGEVQTHFRAVQERWREIRGEDRVGHPVALSGSADASYTNLQEAGVDEPDFVKVGRDSLFVAQNGAVDVIRRGELALESSLPMPEGEVRLFTDEDRLIALAYDYQGIEVLVYRGARLEARRRLSGYYRGARLIDSRLILVLTGSLFLEEDEEPVHQDTPATVEGVSCRRLYRPLVDDNDLRLVKVAVLDTRDPALAGEIAAVVGGGDHIYMTREALYLTKQHVLWGFSNPADSPLHNSLLLAKLAFDANEGRVIPRAAALVPGHVRNQWAFKEYSEEGALLVATTYGDDEGQTNGLFALREEEGALKLAGAVQGFGRTEDIRAVRYVGNTAYVVTFKKTDPLFVFDLSNPFEPDLEGELVIPGFSAYLHPVGPNRLVGVGLDAHDMGDFAWFQGIQVSLFDVGRPGAPERRFNVVLGERGSSSEVTTNHHAFFHAPELSLVGIPVVELTGAGESARWGGYANQLSFSGAVLYRVEENALVETGRISHYDHVPETCRRLLAQGQWWEYVGRSQDVERLYYVDGRVIGVSRYAVTAHDPANPAVVADRVVLPSAAGDCPVYRYGW